jgi:hypothetical protein
VTVRTAVTGKTARRGDEQEQSSRHAAENCHRESEGGRQVAIGFGRNLVQGSERKTALRQMGIERGKAERNCAPLGRSSALHARQQAPEFGYNFGAASISIESQGSKGFHDATRVGI